jgi:hypothetical protein
VTGSIYLGDPGVDRHHLILSSYNEIHTQSFPTFDLTRYCQDFVDPHNCVVPNGRVPYHNFSPSSYAPRARTALSHEFTLDATRGAAVC